MAESQQKAGSGQKNCPECKAVVAAATKTCPDPCGHKFETKSKAESGTKKKQRNRFASLSVADFKLILQMAKDVESGAELKKPDCKKPTAQMFRDASAEEIKQLNADHDRWAIWEASSEMTGGARDKLTKAVNGD